jgi:ribosomal protein L11 methyltransferase
MTWWAVDVQVAPGERETLAAWLVAHTGQAVEEQEDGTLVSWTPDAAGAEALLASLRTRPGPAVMATTREIESTDWETQWRAGLGPRSFGPLTVVPSWIDSVPDRGECVVVLDPENAFGSGEHGSTRAALRLLVAHLRPGDRVLDLGTGSGILAIAAARLGAAAAVGIDLDEEAVEVAERNATRNELGRSVSFIAGAAQTLAPLAGPVDLVTSNILRSVNLELIPAIRTALRPGGLAIFSGMEVGEGAEFRAGLARTGAREREAVEDTGWLAIAATWV